MSSHIVVRETSTRPVFDAADPRPPEITASSSRTSVGSDGGAWETALDALPSISLADLVAHLGLSTGAELLVLAAHPDDETIGLGRLVAQWGAQVGRTRTLLLTDGEACLDEAMPRPPGIASRRLCEWQRATDVLGFASRRRVGLPDAGLSTRPAEVSQALETALGSRDVPPGTLLIAAPAAADPHPDHAAIGQAARRLATERGLPLLEYPIWLAYWLGPEVLARLDPSPVIVETEAACEETFERARACYVSQLQPAAPGLPPVVPDELFERVRRQLVLASPAQNATRDTDS